MLTFGLSEIQKNISIFSTLSEPLKIIDKRKKITLAIVYPVRRSGKIEQLAGKYEKRVDKSLKDVSIRDAKKKAYDIAMEEKYGCAD